MHWKGQRTKRKLSLMYNSEISFSVRVNVDFTIFFPHAHEIKYSFATFKNQICTQYDVNFPNPDIEKYISATFVHNEKGYVFYIASPEIDSKYYINKHENICIFILNNPIYVSWDDILSNKSGIRLISTHNINYNFSNTFESKEEIVNKLAKNNRATIFALNVNIHMQSILSFYDVSESAISSAIMSTLKSRVSLLDFNSEGFIPEVVIADLKDIFEHFKCTKGEVYQSLIFTKFKLRHLRIFQQRCALLGFPYFSDKTLSVVPLKMLQIYFPQNTYDEYVEGFERLFAIKPMDDDYIDITYFTIPKSEQFVIGNSHKILNNGDAREMFTFKMTTHFSLLDIDKETLRIEKWLVKNFIVPQI